MGARAASNPGGGLFRSNLARSTAWRPFAFGVVFMLVLLLGVTLLAGGATVPPRYVGVRITMGRVDPGVLQPGFYLVLPIIQTIRKIDVGVTPIDFENIEAASREYQSVYLTGTLNYRITADKADDLVQTIRDDFDDIVIIPALNDFLKQILPTYGVEEVLLNRDRVRQQAKERMNTNLNQYGIEVTDIYLKNISFSPDYQAAIEKKQTEQQLVQADQQVLARKRIQAEQAVADARGRADAAIETARGEAEANRQLASGITPELVQYLWLQKWDGRMPMVASDATPMVQLPSPPTVTSQSAQPQPPAPGQPRQPQPSPVPR